MQMLIYTPNLTPRIKYIFNFILRDVLQCEFEVTSIAEVFLTSKSPKFSYADEPLANELFFKSASFLKKNTIEKIEIDKTTFGDQKVPFAVESGALPFDIFAASFYFVSRYEEYLPFEADEHQRFKFETSLQYKLGLLALPIVDTWALILKNILAKHFPDVHFPRRKFKFEPTINVDRAFDYRSNGVFNNAITAAKALLKLDTEKVKNIFATGLSVQKDPFDTYDDLLELHAKYKYDPIFFFLLAEEGDKNFDLNVNPKDTALAELIKDIARYAQVGIHPSYDSDNNATKIDQEIKSLTAITNTKTDLSRQHFLKLRFPKTYLQLLQAGINHDYSMGYAAHAGFRAGTCTPFFWYDLQLEKQTALKIHPFAVMDETLRFYLNLEPNKASEKIEELLASVKLVNGTFVSVWHNESLSETGKWKGWRQVYEQMLKDALTA